MKDIRTLSHGEFTCREGLGFRGYWVAVKELE